MNIFKINSTVNALLCFIFLMATLNGMMVFQGARAHAPASLSLSYEYVNNTLSVSITHISNVPSQHYISSVEISVNDVVFQEYTYTSQPGDAFTYNYLVPADEGDIISVTATCNQAGSLFDVITVTTQSPPQVEKNPSIPFSFIVPLSSLLFSVISIYIRRTR